MKRGWLGEAKVSCTLCHWGVQLILTYSWARPSILAAGKGEGECFLLCSPKNFGGAYSRRFVRASVRPCVRASVRPCVRASVRPSHSCPRKFSETACRISMKLHGNIKYQRWMRISPACSGSMIFPRVIAL